MKKYILQLIFLFLVINIYSQHFNMFNTGDPILDDIRYLSVAAGRSFLSFSPPLSPDEIKIFLNSIDAQTLSHSNRIVYDRILNRLTPSLPFLSFSHENYFSVSLNFDFTLETKVRFNNDILWDSNSSAIVPLFKFPLQFFFGNNIQLFIEPTIGLRPGSPPNKDFFYTNIPIDSYHFNTEYWPNRAFLAAGGSWWNFQIGKDNLFWGSAHNGSMVFSNNSILYDYARLSFFNKYIKYSFIINQMPLFIIHPSNPDISLIDNNLFQNAPPQGWQDPENNKSIHRYFYLHRLDINLFERFSFSLIEGAIVGNSPLELRYLNPLLIFHTVYPWKDYDLWINDGHMVGAFFSVELNLNIIKSFSLYGQFVMNQFALPGELSRNIQPPNGMGFLTGLNYTHSFKTWNSIFYLEFIYTEPYLNMLGSPFTSFIQQQNWDYYLISHSRDTISLTAGTEFFNISSLKFTGRFAWISSGEHNKNGLKWDWERTLEAFNKKTPSGIVENKFILSFGAGWKPYSWLSLNAELSGIVSLNNEHVSGNIQTGGQASLSVNINY